MPTNDNQPDQRDVFSGLPDAHGHAALLLVESLIHGLCERGMLSNGDAIGIAERAIEVQVELANANDGASASMRQAHAILSAIAASLRIDATADPALPQLPL